MELGKTLGRRWAYQVRLLAQIACICQTKNILVDTLATMLAEGPVAMKDPPVQDLLNHETSGASVMQWMHYPQHLRSG
jgi:hypothetical protein